MVVTQYYQTMATNNYQPIMPQHFRSGLTKYQPMGNTELSTNVSAVLSTTNGYYQPMV
jgi:hypothetical protein